MIHDTIIAQASAPGNAIRGILRISGKLAVRIAKTIIETPESLTAEHRAVCVDTRISLPVGHFTLPPFPAKLLVWKEGQSYTGDETVEIHTFGTPVLLDAITAALLASSGNVRLAKPGEFTLRAFLSGRLDLAQAEAVLGVIDAESSLDLKTALQQLAGNVSTPLSAVRSRLLDTLTQLEASLDFADEDIDEISAGQLQKTLADASEQIEQLQRKITQRGIDGGKPKIVLTGLHNAGKSTLFNKLLRREAAIVSAQAGTTRDYIEAETDWQGIPVVLIDTAGIGNDAVDLLDEAAQRKTLEIIKQADVVIHCYETMCREEMCPENPAASARTVFFQTKRPAESLDDLFREVGNLLCRSSEYGMLPNTALRCREALQSAGESLFRARALWDPALIALELRNAVNQLGLIDGTIHTEDILENIFSRFCIGK
ncbi:MAG: 50S ribosome-binding GTPase [Planctomycetaceae bacterium]|nr:50S ribosome-binding GTPase [Planctomycetaceae bacterium]